MNKQLQELIGSLINKDYFKLEFGCKVRTTTAGIQVTNLVSGIVISGDITLMDESGTGKHSEIKTSFIYFNKDKLFKILGQEPTLQDLFLALQNTIFQTATIMLGNNLMFITFSGETLEIDLTKNLFNQKDETKLAIYNLLTNNK